MFCLCHLAKGIPISCEIMDTKDGKKTFRQLSTRLEFQLIQKAFHSHKNFSTNGWFPLRLVYRWFE